MDFVISIALATESAKRATTSAQRLERPKSSSGRANNLHGSRLSILWIEMQNLTDGPVFRPVSDTYSVREIAECAGRRI